MKILTPTEVRDMLRSVIYPGFTKDIVSAGFVKGVAVNGRTIVVDFAPNSSNAEKVREMEQSIRGVLAGASFDDIRIKTKLPFSEGDMALRKPIAPDTDSDADVARAMTGPNVMTPLQAELLEAGIQPERDALHEDLLRRRDDPAAGLGGEPPEPLYGPQGPAGDRYEGQMPVFQWEIDPHDPAAEAHESSIRLDDWEIRIWWQVHPKGDLLYASLQAMHDDWADHSGSARVHPVGRQAAVNLVFDTIRDGVVAIYGTVRDFRPFVEAFRQALAAQRQAAARTAQEKGNG